MPAVPNAPTTDDVDEVAGRLMVSLSRLIRRLRQQEPDHLGPSLISALATIVSDGPVRVGDLAAAEGVRASSMTRIVDALVAEGAAERIPDPADGRACLVRSTAAGNEIIIGSRTAKSRQLTHRIGRLDQIEIQTLRMALPVLDALCADDQHLADHPAAVPTAPVLTAPVLTAPVPTAADAANTGAELAAAEARATATTTGT